MRRFLHTRYLLRIRSTSMDTVGRSRCGLDGDEVECSLFNATYRVEAVRSVSTHSIRLVDTINSTLSPSQLTIWNDTTPVDNFRSNFKNTREILKGSMLFSAKIFDGDGQHELSPSVSFAVWSKLISYPASNEFQIAEMFFALSSLMQNITLSLLSVCDLTDSNNIGMLVDTSAPYVFRYNLSLLLGTYNIRS
jgi:hypothetical protein